MTIITRFAPSPTGYLHIGSARTAIFNYLFARRHNGKFLLRVEDTDRERSTDLATQAIFSGLKWLGLEWDDKEVYQFANSDRHAEIAKQLLNTGKAYKCYLTKEELEVLREESRKTGKTITSPWRDRDSQNITNKEFVIRIKAPKEGNTIIHDLVQGDVVTKNEILDDLVLLRSDGTPTYNLAVVVDDHDMNITHIIRGDDHLNNAAKQAMIYEALNWEIPKFAHIPLIHGEDGSKLSKRHGALGVDAYRDLGYLPEAINNYLLRLGWSHGNDEIISRDEAISWFNLESIGKSPARMDFKKLGNVNSHYIKNTDNQRLFDLISEQDSLKDSKAEILKGMDLIKERAKTIVELATMANIFVINSKLDIKPEFLIQIKDEQPTYNEFYKILKNFENWHKDDLMNLYKEYAEANNIKLGKLVMPFRIALTASDASPSIFDIMEIIGKEESLIRMGKFYEA